MKPGSEDTCGGGGAGVRGVYIKAIQPFLVGSIRRLPSVPLPPKTRWTWEFSCCYRFPYKISSRQSPHAEFGNAGMGISLGTCGPTESIYGTNRNCRYEYRHRDHFCSPRNYDDRLSSIFASRAFLKN